MFRLAIISVRAAVRIQRLKYTPEALSVSVAIMDPYRVKALRKVSHGAQSAGRPSAGLTRVEGSCVVLLVC